jgi:hypothetical protein
MTEETVVVVVVVVVVVEKVGESENIILRGVT